MVVESIILASRVREETEYWKIFIGKAGVVAESVVVTFLITFISELLVLGSRPTTLDECWLPMLTATLMGLYSYVRVRGIDLPKRDDDE